MNGLVILLAITGLVAAYIYCMSALGKWLHRCGEASTAVATERQTVIRGSFDASAREKIAS